LADPDAFHLDGSAGGDLPETPVAIVNPKHGRGVMGFQASGLPGTNRREYLAGQFSEPLTPGARYIFTFHITNGSRTPFSTAGLAVGGLGVSFSANFFNQTAWMPLNADPTFRMASPLYNPEWQEVSFVFTATQAFQHFAIGLFGSDAAATIEYREGDSPQFAYYFVDDFSLELAPEDMESDADVVRGPESADSPAVEGVEGTGWFVPNAFTPNRDGENDQFLPIVEESVKVRSFEVYNRWGQVIWTWQPGDAGWDGTIAGGAVNAEPGVFIWKLQLKDAEGRRTEHSGQVALLR
jgi:gliding motility-associated-like protein